MVLSTFNDGPCIVVRRLKHSTLMGAAFHLSVLFDTLAKQHSVTRDFQPAVCLSYLAAGLSPQYLATLESTSTTRFSHQRRRKKGMTKNYI